MTESDVLTRMLHAIDLRDWAAVRDSFASEVYTDYTSLWGGSPSTDPADDLVAGWRQFLAGFSATQHLTGPIVVVDGLARTHVRGHHWRDDDVWTVHGHYLARVADGKITELTLQLFHQSGNLDLPKLAQEGAAHQQP